ncbi:MAG: hypothetical protein GX221_08870 [Candidatus Riflebacteria bacterium]|nr:hypothetical protein [Candidatus Riflebacteria bacterium]
MKKLILSSLLFCTFIPFKAFAFNKPMPSKMTYSVPGVDSTSVYYLEPAQIYKIEKNLSNISKEQLNIITSNGEAFGTAIAAWIMQIFTIQRLLGDQPQMIDRISNTLYNFDRTFGKGILQVLHILDITSEPQRKPDETVLDFYRNQLLVTFDAHIIAENLKERVVHNTTSANEKSKLMQNLLFTREEPITYEEADDFLKNIDRLSAMQKPAEDMRAFLTFHPDAIENVMGIDGNRYFYTCYVGNSPETGNFKAYIDYPAHWQIDKEETDLSYKVAWRSTNDNASAILTVLDTSDLYKNPNWTSRENAARFLKNLDRQIYRDFAGDDILNAKFIKLGSRYAMRVLSRRRSTSGNICKQINWFIMYDKWMSVLSGLAVGTTETEANKILERNMPIFENMANKFYINK